MKTMRKNMLDALLSLLLAAAFVLVLGECNTPLGPRVGSDNAMYLTMGTALAEGYAPYSDIFDHKGPLLFLLQMLPQMAAGGYSTLAVYGQEVLFMAAALLVVGATARRMRLGAWLPRLLLLALMGPCMDGGNLTEEYAALFILAGLYVAQRVFGGQDESGPPKALLLPACALGACAMLAFLTRANNALGLCGMAAGVALALTAKKKFAHLGACALGFALGCALSALPVVAWLAHHDALGDAFYGSIVHNMMYAGTSSERSRAAMLLKTGYGWGAIAMAALGCAGAVCAWRRTKRAALPLGLLLATAFAMGSCFISHKFYVHYLMVLAPIALFGAMQMLAAGPQTKIAARGQTGALAAAVVALLFAGAQANANRLYELEAQGSFAEDAKALYALVPEEDRDAFLAYRVEPKWYVYADALPCMRFYFLQEILADADPAVMDEIVETFETEPPKWLVIYYNREFGPPYDERVAEIFAARYEFVDAKGQYQLLKLKS